MKLKHIEGIGQVVSCVATLQTYLVIVLIMMIQHSYLYFDYWLDANSFIIFSNVVLCLLLGLHGFSGPLQLYTCSVICNFKFDSCIIIFRCLLSFIFMWVFGFPILFAFINVQNIICTIFSLDFFQCKYCIRVGPMQNLHQDTSTFEY